MKYRHQGKDNHKRALLRGTIFAIVKNGGIETSRSRAKDAQKMLDSLITTAKKDTLASRRRVSSLLAADRDFITDFFGLIPSFKSRDSGYTRIIKLGKRKGDSTDMVRLEWVDNVKSDTSIKSTTSKKTKELKEAEGEIQTASA